METVFTHCVDCGQELPVHNEFEKNTSNRELPLCSACYMNSSLKEFQQSPEDNAFNSPSPPFPRKPSTSKKPPSSRTTIPLRACPTHNANTNLPSSFTYCVTCAVPLCSLCLLSTSHRFHQILPLPVATDLLVQAHHRLKRQRGMVEGGLGATRGIDWVMGEIQRRVGERLEGIREGVERRVKQGLEGEREMLRMRIDQWVKYTRELHGVKFAKEIIRPIREPTEEMTTEELCKMYRKLRSEIEIEGENLLKEGLKHYHSKNLPHKNIDLKELGIDLEPLFKAINDLQAQLIHPLQPHISSLKLESRNSPNSDHHSWNQHQVDEVPPQSKVHTSHIQKKSMFLIDVLDGRGESFKDEINIESSQRTSRIFLSPILKIDQNKPFRNPANTRFKFGKVNSFTPLSPSPGETIPTQQMGTYSSSQEGRGKGQRGGVDRK